MKGTDSSKKLLMLGMGYYYNNGVIFGIDDGIKILKTNFKRENLKNIIITDNYYCGPGYNSIGTIFFSKNELPKHFSCEY